MREPNLGPGGGGVPIGRTSLDQVYPAEVRQLENRSLMSGASVKWEMSAKWLAINFCAEE